MSINQEEFKEMLKAKGLKVTNQRLIVLKVLDKHRDIHMAAEDIYKLIKRNVRISDLLQCIERYSCCWRCNWWIGSIWMTVVYGMRLGIG